MNPSDAGIPPIVMLQLLEGGSLGSSVAGEFRAIMAREGVDLATLIDRNDQIPLRWFRELYPEIDVDQATILGLQFAEQAHLTSFGPLSLPLMSAGSVAEVIELLTYLPIISSALSPQFLPTDRGLTVGLAGRTNDVGLDCLVVSYGGYALLRILDVLTGSVSTMTLNLSWPAPNAILRHRQVLEGRVLFGAPTSFVQVPAESLDEVCRFSDPIAYRVSVENLRRALASHTGQASISDRVRRLIERDPAGASTKSVALELSVSVSTLKRRLTEEGTSFRELRQSLLQARATLRLLDMSVSVSDIASDLGYSDVASFSHAFKGWTGRSPRGFRYHR